MKFNEKIIKLRKEKGLSQEQLGYELGVTRQTVSKWELGMTTPEMDKLIEISELFNISLDELLKGEDNSKESSNKENIDQHQYNNYTQNQKIRIPLLFKILIIVVIIAIIVGLGYLIVDGIIKNNNENKDRENKEKIQEKVVDQIDKTNDMDVQEKIEGIIDYYKDNSSKDTEDSVYENNENQNASGKGENNNTQDDLGDADMKELYTENQKLINKAIDVITKDDNEVEERINEIQNYVQNQTNKMNVR